MSERLEMVVRLKVEPSEYLSYLACCVLCITGEGKRSVDLFILFIYNLYFSAVKKQEG